MSCLRPVATPCTTLEATSPDNRRLYERHGFRTIRELTTSDCPPLYALWRGPQAAQSR